MAAALAVTFAMPACGKASAPAGKGGKRAVPVSTAPVKQTTVPLVLESFGTAQAAATVSIRAQVGEVLREVHFKEGDPIAVGELLFTIDQRPFEAALAKAKATLEHDRLQAGNSHKKAERTRTMVAQDLAAQADEDDAVSAAGADAQTVKADEATVAGLQLQVDHCRIVSPIAGRAGKIMITAGNLVQANGDPLVVINQISPIRVFFSVPQADLDRIRRYGNAGSLQVEATLPDDAEHPELGVVDFTDNNVDTATGTIQLGATFANADERLWPGRYVNLRVRLAVQTDAIVVPSQAVVEGGTEGQFVFVVVDGKAALRKVVVARTAGDDDVIESGLAPGDMVVTDGQAQLEDGTSVEVIPDGDATATAGSAP